MRFSQRIGNFLLAAGTLCLFIFAVDVWTPAQIVSYDYLLIGLPLFALGWWLRFLRKSAPPPSVEVPSPPKPAAPAAKKPGLLGGLFRGSAKPAAKPAAPPPPPPKKGLAALFSSKPKAKPAPPQKK